MYQTRTVWLPDGEKFDYTFSRFDRILACDRQTDGQTSFDSVVLLVRSIATLVHKCLNGRAPGYLADDFRLAGRGYFGSRSAASMMLDIPRTTTSLGDTAFAVAGPRVWNSLPPAIRDSSLSPSIFGKLLKTYRYLFV